MVAFQHINSGMKSYRKENIVFRCPLFGEFNYQKKLSQFLRAGIREIIQNIYKGVKNF